MNIFSEIDGKSERHGFQEVIRQISRLSKVVENHCMVDLSSIIQKYSTVDWVYPMKIRVQSTPQSLPEKEPIVAVNGKKIL